MGGMKSILLGTGIALIGIAGYLLTQLMGEPFGKWILGASYISIFVISVLFHADFRTMALAFILNPLFTLFVDFTCWDYFQHLPCAENSFELNIIRLPIKAIVEIVPVFIGFITWTSINRIKNWNG